MDVSITEQVQTLTVVDNSNIAVNITNTSSTVNVAVSAALPTTIASGLSVVPYNTITATNVQSALEQLSDLDNINLSDLSNVSLTTPTNTQVLSYNSTLGLWEPADTLFAETNDLSTAVTWANVPNANITESAVTQHQAALSIAASQVTGLTTALASYAPLASPTFTGTVNINGDFSVTGTTTTVNTTNLDVQDAVITLNKGQATPANDIGLLFQRYSTPTTTNYNIGIAWDESASKLVFGKTPETGSDNELTFNTELLTISESGALTLSVNGTAVNENYVYSGAGGTLTHRVYASRGTREAPLVSEIGDPLIGYAAFPRLSNGFATGPGARMMFIYRGDNSLNIRSTDIEFETSMGQYGIHPRLGIVHTGGIWVQADGTAGTVTRAHIHSDGANILSQRDGTAAQTFNIYNTYTDASNYERGFMKWNANTLEIGTEAGGTGAARNISFPSGNVGIGTSTPVSRLNIVGGSINQGGGTGLGISSDLSAGRFVSGPGVVAIASSTDASTIEISAGSTGGQSGIAVSGFNGDAPSTVRFYSNTTERMRIDSAGNVGIGTTAPAARLDVSTTGTGINVDTTSSYISTFGRNGNTLVTVGGSSSTGQFWLQGTVGGNLSFGRENTTADFVMTNATYIGGGTELFRVSSGGNVGIGTSTPTAKLDVRQTTDNTDMIYGLRQTDSGGGAGNYINFKSAAGASTVFGVSTRGDVSASSLLLQPSQKGTGSLSFVLDAGDITTVQNTQAYRFRQHITTGSALTSFSIEPKRDGDFSYTALLVNATEDTVGTSGTKYLIDLQRNGTSRMVVQSAGNVGIGTSAPAARLDVYEAHTTNGTTAYGIKSVVSGGSNGLNIAGYFSAENTSTMKAIVTGNGDIDFNGRLFMNSYAIIGAGAMSLTESVTSTVPTLMLGDSTPNYSVPGKGGQLIFSGDVVQQAGQGFRAKFAEIRGIKENSTYQNSLGALIFGTQDSIGDGGAISTITEKVRISSGGNVGIGTSAPEERLHIQALGSSKLLIEGDAAGAVDSVGVRFKSRNNTTNWFTGVGSNTSGASHVNYVIANATDANTNIKLVVATGGNVGIGTTTPAAKLHVAGTADQSIIVQSTDNNGKAGVNFKGAGDRGSIYGTWSYDIHIEPNAQYGQADVIINSANGTTMNVGIGTSAPAAKLHVTDTFNNVALVHTGFKLDVTDTASAAGSSLMDLHVGGTSKASIGIDGTGYFGGPYNDGNIVRMGYRPGLPIGNPGGSARMGLWAIGSGRMWLAGYSTLYLGYTGRNVFDVNGGATGLGFASAAAGTPDIGINRDSAGVLKVTDGSTGLGSLSSASLTVSPTYNQTGTAGGTDLLINRTETAIGSGSHYLIDAQVGGTSKFTIDNGGAIRAGRYSGAPGVFYAYHGALSHFQGLFAGATVGTNGTAAGAELSVRSVGSFGWSSTTMATGGIDLKLYRDAAYTLAQRHGTNAQTFNIYNTYTDASNYERGFMKWNANTLEIGTEAGGTGTARNITLNPAGGVVRLPTGSGEFTVSGYGTGTRLVADNGIYLHGYNGGLYFQSNWGSIAKTAIRVQPGSLTTSSVDDYGMSLVQTLNDTTANTGAAYSAFKINVTETDVTGWDSVKLIDAQVGGTSKFSVANTGDTVVDGALTFATDGAGANWLKFYRQQSNYWTLATSGVGNVFRVMGNVVQFDQNVIISRGGLNVQPSYFVEPEPFKGTITFNDVAKVYTAFKLYVTDTASAAGSSLMDLHVGGASKFRIDTAGGLSFPGSSTYQQVIKFSNTYPGYFRADGAVSVASITNESGQNFLINSAGIRLGNSGALRFTQNSAISYAADLELHRDGAGILAQRTGTNAQTFNIYNTYTDASNYERGFMKWNANTLEIGTEGSGTGSSRYTRIKAGSAYFDLVANSSQGQINFPNGARFKFPYNGTTEVRNSANLPGTYASHIHEIYSLAVTAVSIAKLTGEVQTLTTVAATQVASFPITHLGAKLVIQVSDTVSGERQISELTIVHNGTTVSVAEYGIIHTGAASIASYTAAIVSTNVIVSATGASTNSTTYKVVETLI